MRSHADLLNSCTNNRGVIGVRRKQLTVVNAGVWVACPHMLLGHDVTNSLRRFLLQHELCLYSLIERCAAWDKHGKDTELKRAASRMIWAHSSLSSVHVAGNAVRGWHEGQGRCYLAATVCPVLRLRDEGVCPASVSALSSATSADWCLSQGPPMRQVQQLWNLSAHSHRRPSSFAGTGRQLSHGGDRAHTLS